MRSLGALALVLAACGGDKKAVDAAVHDTPVADTAPPIDAPPPTVFTVTCPVTPHQLVTTTMLPPYQYQPSASSISVNGVVEFMMDANHNVVPNATMSDTGLNVGFGEDKCLQFTKGGTFGFHCSVHGFAGSVNVN